MEGLGSLPALSQGQAEHNSYKQAARGDTGTWDTTGEQAGRWPCPELRGAQRKPKLGGQSCPSPWGVAGAVSVRDKGPPGWVACPLAVPAGWALAGWLRRYRSSVRWRVRCWYRGRMERDVNISDLGGGWRGGGGGG